MQTKLMKSFLDTLLQHKYSLLLFLYFFIISYGLNDGRLFIVQTLYIVLSSISIMAILNILARFKYTLWVVILLGVIISFDACFAFKFKSMITVSAIASMFETNSNEAFEFFRDSYIQGILIIVLTFFLLIKSYNELKQKYFSAKVSSIYLFVFFFISIPSIFYVQIKDNEEDIAIFKRNTLFVIQSTSSYFTPLLYNDVCAVLVYINEMSKLKEYINTERTLPEDIYLTKKDTTYQKIYLIIGESVYRKHLSLYGYDVKTTPFLDSLSQSQAVDFNAYDAISSAPMTRDALKLLLTFGTPHNDKPCFSNKNLIDLANDADYQTIWMSNQDLVTQHDSYIGLIASCAKTKCFSEAYINQYNRDDFNLLNLIKSNYDKAKKQFFFIHLMGSHQSYLERYDDVDKQAIPDNTNQYADYERSIHHTDRVIREIYQIAQRDSSSLMLYLSDHGEIVNVGHGFVGKGSSQFEIPYLAVTNKSHSVKPILDKYLDKETNLLNNSNTIYMLAEVLGYHVPEKRVAQSIVDGRWLLHADRKPYMFKDIQKENK